MTNSKLALDDISVFDAIPFLDEVTSPEYNDLIDKAQSVFTDMIRVKQPNAVISCFRTETSNPLVQNLRCRRLGFNFDFDPRGSKQLVELGFSLICVNAFHPSYAINYHPEFSCFKRLLVLEFTKAFALCRNDWNEMH